MGSGVPHMDGDLAVPLAPPREAFIVEQRARPTAMRDRGGGGGGTNGGISASPPAM